MKNYLKISAVSIVFFMSQNLKAQLAEEETIQIKKSSILVENVLTAEEQAELTPNEVLLSFQAGNERFVSSELTARDHYTQRP